MSEWVSELLGGLVGGGGGRKRERETETERDRETERAIAVKGLIIMPL